MNSNQRGANGKSCGKSEPIIIEPTQIFWKWTRLQSIFPGVKVLGRDYCCEFEKEKSGCVLKTSREVAEKSDGKKVTYTPPPPPPKDWYNCRSAQVVKRAARTKRATALMRLVFLGTSESSPRWGSSGLSDTMWTADFSGTPREAAPLLLRGAVVREERYCQ